MFFSFLNECFCNSTRVSNELGARNIDRAKNAMWVTVKLALLLALILDLALGFGHNIWSGFFSDDPEITQAYADLTPFLVIAIAFDAMQISLQGLYHYVLKVQIFYTYKFEIHGCRCDKRMWLATLGCIC